MNQNWIAISAWIVSCNHIKVELIIIRGWNYIDISCNDSWDDKWYGWSNLQKYAEKIFLEVWQCSIGNKDCKYSALGPFNHKTRILVNQKMILKNNLSASDRTEKIIQRLSSMHQDPHANVKLDN